MILQAVDRVCRCKEPGNPDKVLIGCPAENCNKWLHEECLKHDVLMRVFEELGTDKPHKAPGAGVKEEKEEVKRPLSPVEPSSGTVATELPIQVKTDGEGESEVKAAGDSVDVKEERDVAAAEGSSVQAQNGRASNTQTPSAETPRKPGRGRKKAVDDLNYKPYEGLFEATFQPDKDVFEIKDLRDVQGGDKTWLEEVDCLICGSRIN